MKSLLPIEIPIRSIAHNLSVTVSIQSNLDFHRICRYCMAVNVIGFVYSALQSYDLVYFLASGKHMIRNHFKQYFDFFIDQASFCLPSNWVLNVQSINY